LKVLSKIFLQIFKDSGLPLLLITKQNQKMDLKENLRRSLSLKFVSKILLMAKTSQKNGGLKEKWDE